jgi:WD40 repeat protein
MTREREIFEEALEQPSLEARAAFVERATAGDPRLREAVEALLANNVADAFLEQGYAEPLRQSMEVAGKLTHYEEQIGDLIGRYRLLEKIGEGGFGVVYRAAQTDPVRRHVALKVIKLGMDTKSIVGRFEAERQALALMDHPGIARVLDGGATPTGRPFFVMELVRGVRITEYCEANRLSLQERLALFIQLCHAVQHARQKGVIHPDLKPSNVLVTAQDGKPVPKVIDFGVAKAIEEPLTEKTVLTNFHAFIGTPAYTSPEQAEMTGSDVDTRSDIYSLGVLLYELLTGVTPFDAKELTQSGLDGMRRTIKEVEPPTPSTRIRRALAGQPPGRDIMRVDRDLDWVVMKCLEKDRACRYSTAQELAADLQRYLHHEPVVARPQSAAYRWRKAIRRHRTAFAAAAALLLAVAAGTTVSIWQAFRATRAEHTAERGRKNEQVLRLRAEINEYVADINVAQQSILAGNLARATDLLAKHRESGAERFEWRYLWRAAQGDEHKVVAEERSSILSLANSPEWLVVGLLDSVQVYDSRTGSAVKTLSEPGTSVALSSAGLLAAAGKSSVRIWRTSDWAEAYSIPDHGAPVEFSSDGRFLAAKSAKGVRVFCSSDGTPVAEIPNSMPPFAFSPTGAVIAVDTSKGIALWDVGATNRLSVLEDSAGIFNFPSGWVRDKKPLVFSLDGHSVVAARNTLRDGSVFALDVWAAATGKKVATMPIVRNLAEHSGTISSIAFSPNGETIASGSWDHSIRLWDFGGRQRVRALHGNRAEVWSVAFTPDGQIISGAKDGTVRLWPTSASSKERLYEGAWTPLSFSKDGQVLAVMNNQSNFVSLNLRTAEPEDHLQLSAIPWSRRALAISEGFRVLVEPLPKSGLRVWDLDSKKSINVETYGSPLFWAAISPDGTTLVAGGGRECFLWDLQARTAAPVRIASKGARFSRNGAVLITFHDRAFKIWDAKSRTQKAEFTVQADFGFTTAVALSTDGGLLAAGSNPVTEIENAIRVWDSRSGNLIGICKGHTQGVRWLAFAPDGETLASVSDDSTLRLWNVRTQRELLSIQRLADPIREIVFSPEGSWLVAKTMAGLLLLDGARDSDPQKTASEGSEPKLPKQ